MLLSRKQPKLGNNMDAAIEQVLEIHTHRHNELVPQGPVIALYPPRTRIFNDRASSRTAAGPSNSLGLWVGNEL